MRRWRQGATAARSTTGKLASLAAPLLADPGTRWEYSISMDWVGRLVEIASGERFDAYLQNHIFSRLGMTGTSYLLREDQEAQLAKVHQRAADGTLTVIARERVRNPEYFSGGGGLFGTAHDYILFLRMLLQGGRLGDTVLLQPETVALMAQNHTGALEVGTLRSAVPEMTNDLFLMPGIGKGWGLELPDQYRSHADRAQRRQHGMGGDGKLLLLALDPKPRRLWRNADTDPAVRRSDGAAIVLKEFETSGL